MLTIFRLLTIVCYGKEIECMQKHRNLLKRENLPIVCYEGWITH